MPNMDLERRSKSKNGSQSAPRSGPQILVKSGGCPAKYCQGESNVVRELKDLKTHIRQKDRKENATEKAIEMLKTQNEEIKSSLKDLRIIIFH